MKVSRDIGGGLEDLDPQYDADVVRAVKLMKDLPGTPADQEQVYHHYEDKSVPLNPAQQEIARKLAMMRAESSTIYQNLYNGQPQGDTYVHRIAQQKGGLLDRILGGSPSSGRGNVLKKNASASKQRSMMAIESVGTGKRQVVSVINGRVTGWNHRGDAGTRPRVYHRSASSV